MFLALAREGKLTLEDDPDLNPKDVEWDCR